MNGRFRNTWQYTSHSSGELHAVSLESNASKRLPQIDQFFSSPASFDARGGLKDLRVDG